MVRTVSFIERLRLTSAFLCKMRIDTGRKEVGLMLEAQTPESLLIEERDYV